MSAGMRSLVTSHEPCSIACDAISQQHVCRFLTGACVGPGVAMARAQRSCLTMCAQPLVLHASIPRTCDVALLMRIDVLFERQPGASTLRNACRFAPYSSPNTCASGSSSIYLGGPTLHWRVQVGDHAISKTVHFCTIFVISGLLLKTDEAVAAIRKPRGLIYGLVAILAITPMLAFGVAVIPFPRHGVRNRPRHLLLHAHHAELWRRARHRGAHPLRAAHMRSECDIAFRPRCERRAGLC